MGSVPGFTQMLGLLGAHANRRKRVKKQGGEEEQGVEAQILDCFQLVMGWHPKDSVSRNVQSGVPVGSCPALVPRRTPPASLMLFSLPQGELHKSANPVEN